MAGIPWSERVVEVIADFGPDVRPRIRYGSGCRVAGRTVLTGAHVVAGARAVSIRGPDKVKYSADLDPAFVGDPNGPGPDLAPDLALLVVIEGPEMPALPLAGVDRTGTEDDGLVLRCRAVGYPQFAERNSRGQVRETVQANGHIPVLSQLVSGLLTLEVSSSPRELPPAQQTLGASPWAGMSGAPVLADGYLVGVVTEHAPRAGPSTIMVTPLTAVDPQPGDAGWGRAMANPAEWWARLGALAHDCAWLPRLPQHRGRPAAPYRATIREIHSRCGHLLGRETELVEITDFATGPPGYRWLVGDAWAGKTSLLAEAVTNAQTDRVEVVAYFLSQREVDADANRFLAAVVPQLAELLDEDPPPLLDVHYFRALWARAADKIAADDRFLLLVVDGLDEDLRPSGTPSVASLLPAIVPGRAHVLVSSRLRPELPTDVFETHPLRAMRQERLEPFAGSAELERRALQEVDRLKQRDDDGLALTVFGVLTAAAGPLAIDDIVTLTAAPAPSTPKHTTRVRRLVDQDAGRSLQCVGSGTSIRYQFAHASLMQAAQEDPDLADPDYRVRIHDWARTWSEAGWPAAANANTPPTPRYLLGEYLTTLTNDLARQQTLASDIRWSVAAIQALGVDRVLAELEPAAHAGGNGAPAEVVYALIRAQVHYLRHAEATHDPGFAARQLCLRALELGEDDLSEILRRHLLSLCEPGLVPLWTTWRISRALVLTLTRGLNEIAVLPDGRVATGGRYDGQVRVWNLDRPNAYPIDLGCAFGYVDAITALPDGRIVTGSSIERRGGWVEVWDPNRPDADPVELGYAEDSVAGIAALPDGRFVTGLRDDGWMLVWDPSRPDADPLELGWSEDRRVDAIMALPDGRIVIGSIDHRGDRWVEVWDPNRPDADCLELDEEFIGVLPDGRIVIDFCGEGMEVWDPNCPDTTSSGPVYSGEPAISGVPAFAVLPDGRIVTGDGGRVLVWDSIQPDGTSIEVGRAEGFVHTIVALPDGRIVTSSSGLNDGWVQVWDPSRADATHTGASPPIDSLDVLTVLLDGRIVTVRGSDGSLLMWDPRGRDVTPLELGHAEGEVGKIATLPGGRIATSSRDGRVLVWDTSQSNATPVELGHAAGIVTVMTVLPDGRIATARNREPSYLRSGLGNTESRGNGCVEVWDPNEPYATPIELGCTDSVLGVTAMAVLPDGRITTGSSDHAWSDGRVLVWDPHRSNADPIELGRTNSRVNAMAVLPDSRIVTGDCNGRVLLWAPHRPDADAIELGWAEDPRVDMIAVLPDGRIVTCDGNGEGWMRVRNPSSPAINSSVACDVQWLAVAVRGGATYVVGRHPTGVSAWLVPQSPEFWR